MMDIVVLRCSKVCDQDCAVTALLRGGGEDTSVSRLSLTALRATD